MLKINETRLLTDIKNKCNYELDKMARILVQYMIFEVNEIPYSGSYKAVGEPDWRLDVINALKYVARVEGMNLVRDVGIIKQDENTLMKAGIIEFGMGKFADMSNPWISEYLSSDKYHSERQGMNVLGRKGKSVYDINEDAWNESTARHDKEIPHFKQYGSHFWTKVFGNSSTLAQSHFNKALENINTYINTIDITKYLENTNG